MNIEDNPFVTNGFISDKYFCGRDNETARMIKSLTNGNNMVLISPRRMGKTALIQSCYTKSIVKNNYRTFHIDILNTSSLRELTFLLGRSIYETLMPRGRKLASQFLSYLKSISGRFGFDAVTGFPEFNIRMGDIEQPELTLEEIFKYLDGADRPCIVAIDEFQQICKYPEKNVEALLRSHIQKIRNCHFIFSGSESHIMQEMFLAANRPFYMSADLLELGPIPPETYIPFAEKMFRKNGRKIEREDVEKIYNLFKGHTYYMQNTFNKAFSDTPSGGICTIDTIQRAIESIVEANSPYYRKIMSNIPERQKELLCAIAKEGDASKITSAAFLRRHTLSSSSSVQAAAIKLFDNEIITERDKIYSVYDRFFAVWINNVYGTRLDLRHLDLKK